MESACPEPGDLEVRLQRGDPRCRSVPADGLARPRRRGGGDRRCVRPGRPGRCRRGRGHTLLPRLLPCARHQPPDAAGGIGPSPAANVDSPSGQGQSTEAKSCTKTVGACSGLPRIEIGGDPTRTHWTVPSCAWAASWRRPQRMPPMRNPNPPPSQNARKAPNPTAAVKLSVKKVMPAVAATKYGQQGQGQRRNRHFPESGSVDGSLGFGLRGHPVSGTRGGGRGVDCGLFDQCNCIHVSTVGSGADHGQGPRSRRAGRGVGSGT